MDKNELKQAAIAAGIESGYFRAKDEDKRALLAADIANNEAFSDCEEGLIVAILVDETIRRHLASQERTRRTIARQIAEENKPLTGGVLDSQAHVKPMPPGIYLVSVAQNNTEANVPFLRSLQNYASRHGAQILLAKTTYNKNAFSQNPGAESEYYSPDIAPYLVTGTLALAPTLHFLADANIIVTSRGNPLSGFEGATPSGVSAILGTASVQLSCTPALKGQKGKVLFGTGAVTLPNYIMRKAGAVAASTHNIAALLVTVQEGGEWEARQIEQMPDTEGFIDSGVWYKPDGTVTMNLTPDAWQFGDIHAEKLPDSTLYEMRLILDSFEPKNLILHDLLDMSSRNHHNIKSPTFRFTQHVNKQTVLGDLQRVAYVTDTLAESMPDNGRITIIESNHDLALSKWLDTTQPGEDPENAVTWLQCTLAQYRAIERGDKDFHALRWACYNLAGLTADCVFHGSDDSIMIAGVEMGNHGHSGANGAKGGGARGFAKLGVRTNTGHTHTPGISNGLAYVAGIAAGNIDFGYNIGPSSWRMASICTWGNGARQIIFHD